MRRRACEGLVFVGLVSNGVRVIGDERRTEAAGEE